MFKGKRPIDKFSNRMIRKQAARADSIRVLSHTSGIISAGKPTREVRQTDKDGNKYFRFDVSEVDGQDLVE